jgi:hypothetical protein
MIQTTKVSGPAGTVSNGADGWRLRLGTFEKVNAAAIAPSGSTTSPAHTAVVTGVSGNVADVQVSQSGVILAISTPLQLLSFLVTADGC